MPRTIDEKQLFERIKNQVEYLETFYNDTRKNVLDDLKSVVALKEKIEQESIVIREEFIQSLIEHIQTDTQRLYSPKTTSASADKQNIMGEVALGELINYLGVRYNIDYPTHSVSLKSTDESPVEIFEPNWVAQPKQEVVDFYANHISDDFSPIAFTRCFEELFEWYSHQFPNVCAYDRKSPLRFLASVENMTVEQNQQLHESLNLIISHLELGIRNVRQTVDRTRFELQSVKDYLQEEIDVDKQSNLIVSSIAYQRRQGLLDN